MNNESGRERVLPSGFLIRVYDADGCRARFPKKALLRRALDHEGRSRFDRIAKVRASFEFHLVPVTLAVVLWLIGLAMLFVSFPVDRPAREVFRLLAFGFLGAGGGAFGGACFGPSRVRAVIRAALACGLCPQCRYVIASTPDRPDGCVVCPECGAAWRVGVEPAGA